MPNGQPPDPQLAEIISLLQQILAELRLVPRGATPTP